MTTGHLTKTVLALPPTERLALVREIMASLPIDEAQQRAVEEGVRRMEAMIQGHVTGLTQSQFRHAPG